MDVHDRALCLNSMSWLRRRLKYLQLNRRGPGMQWDRDSLVKMCVEVNSCHMHPKINTFYHVIE